MLKHYSFKVEFFKGLKSFNVEFFKIRFCPLNRYREISEIKYLSNIIFFNYD